MDIKDYKPEIDFETMLIMLNDDTEEMALAQTELDHLVHSIETNDTVVHVKNNLDDFIRIYCTNWFLRGMKYGAQMQEAVHMKIFNP